MWLTQCYGNYKNSAKELHMKDTFTIAVTDHNLRKEFKKLKGADNMLAKYEDEGRVWDFDNWTRDAFRQNKAITSQDIHVMSNHQSKTYSHQIF